MKVIITILVITNVILSFLQAEPSHHRQSGRHSHQGHQGQRGHHGQGGHGMNHPPVPPLWMLIDQNQDGMLSAEEIAKSAEMIAQLDANGDGMISLQELPPPPHAPQGQGGQQGRPSHGGGAPQQQPQDNGGSNPQDAQPYAPSEQHPYAY